MASLSPSVCVMAMVLLSTLITYSDQKTLKPCLKSGCLCGKSRDPVTGKMSAMTANCERVNYKDIPNFQNVSTRTERILLVKNKITTIRNDSFSGLKVKEIDFSENKISVIQHGAFSGIEGSLQKLVLKSNRLTRLPVKALSRLRKLKYLDLSSNEKLNISAGAFGGLKALETLILSQCNIKVIKYGMFRDLINLKLLKLDKNIIKDLGTVLKDMTKLEELDLSYNQLTRVTPSSINKNKNIVKLNLKYNDLTSLPPVLFKGFKKLKILNLEGNPIKKPYNLKTLSSISRSLEHLDLNMCAFSKWPVYPVGNLRKLKTLEIENNSISKIPAGGMKNMTSLEVLKLSSNPIQFTAGMFDGAAESLHELYLRGLTGDTPLTKLPLKQLKHVKSLALLDASHNGITEIDKDFFDGLSATHYVFQENKIQNISSEAFVQFTTPIKLDLSDNMVADLNFVEDPSKFSMINVSFNKIFCDCHVFNLSQVDTLELVGHCDNHRMDDSPTSGPLIIGSDHYVKIFTSLCKAYVLVNTSSDPISDAIGDAGTNTTIEPDDTSGNVPIYSDGLESSASENHDTSNAPNLLISKCAYYITAMILLYHISW